MIHPAGYHNLGPAERRLCERSHQVTVFLDPYFSPQEYKRAPATYPESEILIRRKGKIAIQTKENEKAGLAWSIGQRIKATRKNNRWTQDDLAERSGIARANIARLESGRHRPGTATLSRIAHALNLDISNLLKGPSYAAADEDLTWLESGLAEWSSTLKKEDR